MSIKKFILFLAFLLNGIAASAQYTLNVGEIENLYAPPTSDSRKPDLLDVRWTTSDRCVTIQWNSQNPCQVRAESAGTARILCTARYYKRSDLSSSAITVSKTYTITCIDKVDRVYLTPSSLSLEEGETAVLKASVEPSTVTDKTVSWESDDYAVASVSSNGVVTARGPGYATITCTSNADRTKSARCHVEVTAAAPKVLVSKISLVPSSLSMLEGESQTLQATVEPYDASNREVTWSSTNSQVASVSGGRVTAVGEGSAVITCHATDGSNVSAQCNVTVKRIKVTSLKLDKSTLSLDEGGSYTLQATISPNDATHKTLTWSSDATGVAEVSNGKVTAKYEGTATITCRTTDGSNLSATCKVTVTPVQPTKVEIPSLKSLFVGDSETLTATITPSNARTTLTWYCEPASGVITLKDGTITAVGEGTANVYCKTSNGITSNKCRIESQYHRPTSLTLSATSLSFREGESQQLTATVVPSNSHYTLTWTSSNTAVATVSQTGLVKAVGGGTAQITVATDNGLKATCSVTSLAEPKAISVPSAISLYPGSQRQLKYTLDPIGARDEVVWRGSNPNVVTVTEKGLLTAVGPGQARVTAITHNGLQATCRVVVPEPDFNLHVFHHSGEQVDFPLRERPSISVEEGTLRITTASTVIEYAEESIEHFTIDDMRTNELPTAITIPAELRMNYREHATLDYTLYPEDYDIESNVKWETSDRYVAQVDDQGHVYANLPGECTITATTHNGHTSECRVTVADHDFYLVLWHKTGEKTGYKLKAHPQVTYTDPSGGFGEGEVLTVLSSEVRIDYPAGSIKKFTLNSNPDGIPDGIRAIEADGPAPGTIDVTHARPGSTISIYDAAGHCLAIYTADGEGRVSYSLDAYPQGIYIIKTETTTFKITKQ